jgi:hypothetical protein
MLSITGLPPAVVVVDPDVDVAPLVLVPSLVEPPVVLVLLVPTPGPFSVLDEHATAHPSAVTDRIESDKEIGFVNMSDSLSASDRTPTDARRLAW